MRRDDGALKMYPDKPSLRLQAHSYPIHAAECVQVVDADHPTLTVAHVYLLASDRAAGRGHAVTLVVSTPFAEPAIYTYWYEPFEPHPRDLALRVLEHHSLGRMRVPLVEDVELGDELPASVRRVLQLDVDVHIANQFEDLFPPLFDEEDDYPQLFGPDEDGPYLDA
jgi:hypothetical protein